MINRRHFLLFCVVRHFLLFCVVAAATPCTDAAAQITVPFNITVPAPLYLVAVSASPSADGTVSGGGLISAGSSVTVTATPNSGFSFVNWTQNGSAVSTSASYTFTLNSNTTLVANFTPVVATVMPAENNVSTNWQKAGLLSIGGIPTNRTVCTTVSPTLKTPPVSGDDSITINAAINGCGAGTIVQLAAGTFQIDQSEYIALNKGVTLRGTGNCTNASSPYCQTVINVYNGALADWTISATQTGAMCGVTSSSPSACSAAAGVILMSPSTNYNWGWGGCNLGTTPTSCGTTLDADVAQGATTVQVHSTTNFSVGMWVLIDEDPKPVSTTNPTGGAALSASPEFLNSSGSPATMRLAIIDTINTYSMAPSRLNQEIHLITAIGAGPCPGTNCTLTFDSPLTLAFRQSGSHDARVFWPTVQGSASNPFLQQAGVENLTITKAANSGIEIEFCAYCWVKNVEVGGWIAGAVNIEYSARAQIEFNYFHDCDDCENNGTEYPIGINSGSTESYVVNNIILRGGKGMVGRGANTAVVAYNYQDDTFYMAALIGDYWLDMGVNGSHFGGTHHFLFEGNWGDNCDGDETHGNAIYHVFFRNDCTGIRTTFTDPSINKTVNDAAGIGWASGSQTTPAPMRAAGPMAFNYWYAFVGNVLGLAGVTTTANGWVYKGGFCGGCGSPPFQTNKAIWMSGWVGGEWPNMDLNLIATTGAYIFRHGNYDYVNGAINDWASGYTQSLPNSLYLSSAPSFFGPGASCTYPWPWVSSTSSPPILTNSCGGPGLPAKARWAAATPFVQP